MEIIIDKLNNDFQTKLINILNENLHKFNDDNDRINYINLYHKDWEKNSIYELFKSNNILNDYTVGQIGIIESKPKCNNQLFHIDYSGKTFTLFIPMIDINDKNGTEYLYFYDQSNYIKYYNLFLDISNKYSNREDIINYLKQYDIIYNVDYCFKIANANKFSLIKLPNYVFHRGKTNETNQNRYMFQIIFLLDDYKLTDDKIILDAELDENNKDILKYRLND